MGTVVLQLSQKAQRTEISSGVSAGNEASKPNQTPHKKRTKKDAGVKDLLKLLEDQGYKCALCGLPLTMQQSALDHVIPLESGGTNELDNLQFVLPAVNKMKNTMSQEEFIALCCLVADHSRAASPSVKSPERLWYEAELQKIRAAINTMTATDFLGSSEGL